MNQHELIEQLAAAGHDVSSYEVTTPPPRRKAPTVGSRSFDQLAVGIIDELVVPLLDKIDALAARIKELEARPTLRYAGVWGSGGQYSPGEFVTDQGSVWHCGIPTSSRPPGQGWTLAVKRGRDTQPRGTALPRS